MVKLFISGVSLDFLDFIKMSQRRAVRITEWNDADYLKNARFQCCQRTKSKRLSAPQTVLLASVDCQVHITIDFIRYNVHSGQSP